MADAKISALPASTTPLSGTEVLPIVQSGATKQVSIANLTTGREVFAGTLSVGGTNAPAGFGSKVLVEGGDASIANAFALKLWSSGNNDVNTIKTTGTRQLSVFNNDGADECLRVTYNRDIQAIAGNFIVGTSGKGIDFSADGQAAGMTSELLDDYEEGTFTPTLINSSGLNAPTYTTQTGVYTKVGDRVDFSLTVTLATFGTLDTGGLMIPTSCLPFAPRNVNSTFYVYFTNFLSSYVAVLAEFIATYGFVLYGQAAAGVNAVSSGAIARGNIAETASIRFNGTYFV